MVVISIVIITIIVFVLVDLLLRMILTRVQNTRILREREQALNSGLKLDVSEESPTLKRAELEQPKARILAVDDEQIILDGFRKMLVLGGYSIDTVETGAEALGLIRKHDYDFVFTDLKMPGMDGVEVTKSVKHMRPDIDVVVITGFATVESAVETVKHGAVDYLQKPFTEDELIEFVSKAVIRRNDRLERQARHKIRLIVPGTSESKSRFELNVPAGAFVSPEHTWAAIRLNGTVRIGLDDMMRKLFGTAVGVTLPEPGTKIEKGVTLFTVDYGDFSLDFPAPISGRVVAVNSEHSEHPDWLSIKPFELSWMCGIEPVNLAAELPGLKIGKDMVSWYQQELDRFSELVGLPDNATEPERQEGGKAGGEPGRAEKMVEFSKLFLADSTS